MSEFCHQSQRVRSLSDDHDVVLEVALEERLSTHFPVEHHHSNAGHSISNGMNTEKMFDRIEERVRQEVPNSNDTPERAIDETASLLTHPDHIPPDNSIKQSSAPTQLNMPAKAPAATNNEEGGDNNDDGDNSTISSHTSDFPHGYTASDVEADGIHDLLHKTRYQESIDKLSRSLSQLWFVVNSTRQEAEEALNAERKYNATLHNQARAATNQLEKTEACMAQLTNRNHSLERQNRKLSNEVERLKSENRDMEQEVADSELQYMNLKNMLSKRDLRIAELEEETIILIDALAGIDSRAEAEVTRRTWSELRTSHSRDTTEYGGTTTEQEEALSQLKAPFVTRRQSVATTGSGAPVGESPTRIMIGDGIAHCEADESFGLSEITTRSSKDLHSLTSAVTHDEEEGNRGKDEG